MRHWDRYGDMGSRKTYPRGTGISFRKSLEPEIGIGEGKVILAKTRNELEELKKADEITAKVLDGSPVTTEEYRYIVLFNLRALTQIMWEISKHLDQASGRKSSAGASVP